MYSDAPDPDSGGGRDKRNLVDLQFFRNFNMKKKDIVSREAERQFLALLRAGLWGGKADMACFPESGLPDWKGILYLGRSQAVLPLIYDGMLTLPEEMRLHGPALMRLIAYVDRIEGLNRELDEASAEISARLAAEGIRSVLLKGQGLAVLYRIPGHRQCGDIDLYVGEENYRKAADIIRKWPEMHEERVENSKHIGFKLGDIELELHKHAFDMPGMMQGKKYRKYENTELGNSRNTITLGRKITVDSIKQDNSSYGEKITLPPVQFNIFYIFCHAFTHFMEAGLGLRQFCDIAMYLHRYNSELATENLRETLINYNLYREWKIFISLIVNHLGLPKNEAPFYDSSIEQISNKLLQTVLNDGNFGQHKDLPKFSNKPKFIRKFGNLFIHHILLARRFKFSKRQTIIYYFHIWKDGIKNTKR